MKFCNKPFDSIHVLPGGDMWACGWMHLAMGNLAREDLNDIWHGERARLARESILDGSFRYCRKTSCPFLENDSLPDLDEEALKKAAVVSENPQHISAAFDLICNHACPSCRQKIFVPDEQYILDLNQIAKQLLPVLNEAKTIGTNGNGDFFSSPYLMDLLEKVRPIHKDCKVIFETNGALFDEKHWNRISHLGQYHLSITVTPNSFARDTFRYLSGGVDDLDQVTQNLHFIRKLREEGQINDFKISIVVQDRNFRETPSFIRTCLEEYHADQVVVKPLYQWFGMKEDVYWFKNILNPLHPYHQEYLEMRKDPIFDDPRVFDWGGNNLREPKEHPAYQYRADRDMLMSLLRQVMDTSKDLLTAPLEDILVQKGVRSIALYDAGEMGQVLAELLLPVVRRHGGSLCFLNRFHSAEDAGLGLRQVSFPDFDPQSADLVVVTDLYHYDKLCQDIRKLHYSGEILSAASFITDLAAPKKR